MNKLWLIIKREYLTRVTRKQFIIATLITPLAFALLFGIVGLIFAYQNDAGSKIAVVDEGNVLDKTLPDSRSFYFSFPDQTLPQLKKELAGDSEFDGILVIPKLDDLQATRLKVLYYSDAQLDLDRSEALTGLISERLREYKIQALKMDSKQLDALDVDVSVDPEPLSGEESPDNNPSTITSAIGAGLGALMGIIMYIMVFLNGAMVMRSVMEEKMNRIVEVMISSVKPFQLMIGKVIGVGAVGITQMLIWVILMPLFGILVGAVFGTDMSATATMPNTMPAGAMDPEEMEATLPMILHEIGNQNWWLIVPLFFLFFLGGYFVYASLFAAVGSAIGDDLGESNSLTLPITIPVILAFYIMFVAIRAPNSSLAVWASIFPLFSPIVMPARLAFSPPGWQIALSIALLALAVVFFVWISGRIYRVGILMYGKKASFKELWKWLWYKG